MGVHSFVSSHCIQPNFQEKVRIFSHRDLSRGSTFSQAFYIENHRLWGSRDTLFKIFCLSVEIKGIFVSKFVGFFEFKKGF